MRKIAAVLSYLFIFLLYALPLYAQQAVHPAKGFPEYHKYWRKDSYKVKINYYEIDTLLHPIPMGRAFFHDKIDNEQKQDDLADGKADHKIKYGKDSTLTEILSASLLDSVDHMQVMIENMPANGREAVMDNQQRIRYLRAVWEMMRQYSGDPKPDPLFYQQLVNNMHDMLIAANENKLMPFVMANTNIFTLDNGKVLFDNQPEARAYVYTEMEKKDPLLMIKRLQEYANDTFAANIIKVVARMQPEIIFNYASSTNSDLKGAVYRTQDELVQTIVKIAAHSRSPLKLLPFISDVYYGRKSIAELDTIADHPDLYFENLVRLKLSNDSIAKNVYTQELIYRALRDFVRPMNDMHDEPKEEIRFRCIDSLPASSLYFLMVYGQDEIYTSTFLGTFKRMMERMKPLQGNEFLDSLHYDHFRTFIRMSAGYNTLSDFLGSMSDTARTTLMTNFIGNLQKGGENDLEDAVDVADAFGSIRDSALSSFLENKVKENYELSYSQRSKKGMIVYSLLAMLFEGNKISGSDTGAAVASSRLKLPPINKVLYKDLVNDSGIVYQQVFFYGDEDGQNSYDSYLTEFKKDKNWHIDTTNKMWTVISSVKGKKVVIYANLPLKQPDDENAQDSLIKFLDDSGIHPTIMIHRGHSYHLPVTLSKLNKNVKIVILGSCGGYHNLALVLDHAPDAHIVSSKQVGATWVNEPIIKALNARLLDGQDINWIDMWQELDTYFAKKPDLMEKFDDYVPPYKNLGAIFIKAYRRMMRNDTPDQN